MGRMSVTKQTMQNSDMEIFYFERLHEVEGKEQYQVKISYRFAALENLDDDAIISLLDIIHRLVFI
jgi:hypothetical protein